MAVFDNVIEDVAGRFGLDGKAGPLLREVVQLITGSPGGIGGFIDKFKSAGLGAEVGSWLGKTDGVSLTGPQVEKALGSTVIDGIAGRLGLSGGGVSTAIGYLAPKLIGQLTPGGVIPSGIPAAVSGFLGSTASAAPRQTVTRRVEQVAPIGMTVIHDAPHLGRWLIPLLAGLGVLGLFWYLLSGTTPAPVVTAPAPVVTAPAPIPSMRARLALSEDNGTITYSGAVHDASTRASIIDSLKAVFGADKIKGDIAVDANAGPAPWLIDLRTALEHLKTPGVQAVFDGNSLRVGGLIGETDRDRIIGSLRSALGPGLAFGSLTDKVGDLVTSVTTKSEAALAALRPGFSANDLLSILNQSIINFPTGGTEIPAISKALLQNAAASMKQLPPSTVIEIGGHTDNTGDAAANMMLSQQRAEAVRAELVQDGVDPGMLVVKGYGSAKPIAGNDTVEGRFANRRIEYRVVKQ
jgi:OOP family OmpA-OmpF porin